MVEDRFNVMKEEVVREYANMAYQQPYQWAMYRCVCGSGPCVIYIDVCVWGGVGGAGKGFAGLQQIACQP